MPRVEIVATTQPSWPVKCAVLVYGDAHNAYATVHAVAKKKGQLRLGAGRPATKEACAELARALGANANVSGFTPPELLYLGAGTLVWWRPPGAARMFFQTAKERDVAGVIGKRNGVMPQPGLVFAVNPSGWFVYAVANNERPTPATTLYRAPYLNVWPSGEICTGNVKLPDALSHKALADYERAFFDSNFTHSNMQPKQLLVRGQGPYAFWRDGLDGKWTTGFPVKKLVPLKLTLEGLVKQLESGKGGRDVDLGA